MVSTSKNSAGNVGASTMILLVGIIGLVVGLGVGYGAWHKAKSTSSTQNSSVAVTTDTKAAGLRAALVSLGVQHMDLTNSAVDAALDGAPGADAAKADLIKNGQNIAAAVGSVYGQAAQAKFDEIWNVHLNGFVKYAVADKSGDTAGMKAALDDIATNYTKPISVLLSGANPNLPEATLESAFGEHVDMTAQMIDDHVKAKYSAESAQREMAATHISGLMSTLAGAIVKQYPDKFNG